MPARLPYALIVEDDFMTTMKASVMFSDLGYEPIDALNPAQALLLLRSQGAQIEIMFTDVVMPGPMNGFELAHKVSAEWPHIQIVVVSGKEWPELGDLPDHATFIFKPFSADVIAEHLDKLASNRGSPSVR